MKFLSDPSWPPRKGGLSTIPKSTFILVVAILINLPLAIWLQDRFPPSPTNHQNVHILTSRQQALFDENLSRCHSFGFVQPEFLPIRNSTEPNPRWQYHDGENTKVLKNALLFDGEAVVPSPVDIFIHRGSIESVASTGTLPYPSNVVVIDLQGRWVTPGLVDLHSHAFVLAWPLISTNSDGNEVHSPEQETTSALRSLDGMKTDDAAIPIARSGGITSALILPGSANVIGGEGFVVKLATEKGKLSRAEDLLLQKNEKAKRRYMKLAWGENPRRVYKRTRMGIAWALRRHLQRAKSIKEKQDLWCENAHQAQIYGSIATIQRLLGDLEEAGMSGTESLELESTIALLRGQVWANVHDYRVNDFETVLRIMDEFNVTVHAFHHGLEAWRLPELFIRENR